MKFFCLALAAALTASGQPLERLLEETPRHLRMGEEREWNEFPERAELTELVIPFDA